MHVCVPHAYGVCTVSTEAVEEVGSLRTAITGSCEPPYECWEQNQVKSSKHLTSKLFLQISKFLFFSFLILTKDRYVRMEMGPSKNQSSLTIALVKSQKPIKWMRTTLIF